MSVINQMLSRLDERRAATPDASATGAAGGIEAVPKADARRLGWMALGGATLITAAAFGQWPALMGAPAAVPQPVTIPQDLATAVAREAMPMVPVDPAPSAVAEPVAVVALEAVPVEATPLSPRERARARAANTDSGDTPAPHPTLSPEGRGLQGEATTVSAIGRRSAAPLAASPPVSPLSPWERARVRAASSDSGDLPAPHPTLSPTGRGLQSEPTSLSPAGRGSQAPPATVALASPPPVVAHIPPRGSGSVEKRVIPPSAAQRAAQAYQQAIDQAASGHSHPAIGLALDALKADPDHIPARELAAVLMIESKRLGDAAALMRDGLERQPQQPHLVMLLARIEAEGGSAQAALDRLSAAPGLDSHGHGLRAALLARAERYREAAAAYEAAVRLQPDNAAWWFGLGVALDADGQAPLARQALERARAIGSLRGDALAYVEQKLSN